MDRRADNSWMRPVTCAALTRSALRPPTSDRSSPYVEGAAFDPVCAERTATTPRNMRLIALTVRSGSDLTTPHALRIITTNEIRIRPSASHDIQQGERQNQDAKSRQHA